MQPNPTLGLLAYLRPFVLAEPEALRRLDAEVIRLRRERSETDYAMYGGNRTFEEWLADQNAKGPT